MPATEIFSRTAQMYQVRLAKQLPFYGNMPKSLCGVMPASAGGGGMSMRGSSMELPSSLVTWPPTVTAAAWKALEDRAAAAARQTRVASEETVRVS